MTKQINIICKYFSLHNWQSVLWKKKNLILFFIYFLSIFFPLHPIKATDQDFLELLKTSTKPINIKPSTGTTTNPVMSEVDVKEELKRQQIERERIEKEKRGCCVKYAFNKQITDCIEDLNSITCVAATVLTGRPMPYQELRKGISCTSIPGCPQSESIKPTKSEIKPTKPETKPLSPLKFTPSVTIPGSEFKAGEAMAVSKDNVSDLLARYISAIFEFFVVVSAILAVLMILIAGIKWMLAFGSSEKVGEARKMISNAIIGLVLALATYTILNLINPNLVILKSLDIASIKKIELEINEEEISPQDFLDDLVSIRGLDNIDFNDSSQSKPLLTRATAEKLKKAALELKGQGIKLTVTNAYRSYEDQKILFNKSCSPKIGNNGICPSKEQKKCKEGRLVCCPTKDSARCPHQTGMAVDVFCVSRKACQKKVIQAMKNAGFCKLKSEDWHFESEQISPSCYF